MKRLILLMVIALTSICSFAQDGKGIYNKYSDAEDVSAVFISPAIFKMMGTMPNMEVNELDINLAPIVKSLKGFYLLDSENKSISKAIESDVQQLVKEHKYELMMEVKENGEKVRMYVISKEDIISNLIMIVSDEEETVFISLSGSMERTALEKLMVNSLNGNR